MEIQNKDRVFRNLMEAFDAMKQRFGTGFYGMYSNDDGSTIFYYFPIKNMPDEVLENSEMKYVWNLVKKLKKNQFILDIDGEPIVHTKEMISNMLNFSEEIGLLLAVGIVGLRDAVENKNQLCQIELGKTFNPLTGEGITVRTSKPKFTRK